MLNNAYVIDQRLLCDCVVNRLGTIYKKYILFQLSRPRFGSGSSRRRSQHILYCIIIISAFLAVRGMPIDMYRERRRRD